MRGLQRKIFMLKAEKKISEKKIFINNWKKNKSKSGSGDFYKSHSARLAQYGADSPIFETYLQRAVNLFWFLIEFKEKVKWFSTLKIEN